MPNVSSERVFMTLAAEAQGLSAPELLRRLRHRISQPTLWRILAGLRGEGRLIVEGRARATRYRAASPVELASRRSLYMHRSVARRIARDPDLRNEARGRLAVLRRVNPHGHRYHDRWERLLDGPIEMLLRTMTEDSADAETLRKESPFTTLVTERERQQAFSHAR